eukprot:TRINITY_DN1010_c0_g1_i1.p1 TRINITY_DN1010_c0_g1~~TRINITY_DN1010_c0_g1_i1.p1  ORF type:complete len:400 (-),score=41.21 TRINITY_DN1010_c0_g1_i1:1388-2515(-)
MANFQQTLLTCCSIFISSFGRGLTSFGMGVLFLTAWIIFSVCQLDTGNLKHAVPVVVLNQTLCSLPLLYLYNANKFGDYGISIAILIPSNIACIIGTDLLRVVPIKKLELSLAVVLFFVVLIRAITQIKESIKKSRQQPKEAKEEVKQIENQDEDNLKTPLITDEEEAVIEQSPKEEEENDLSQWGKIAVGTKDAFQKFGWMVLLTFSFQVQYKKEDRSDFYTTFAIVTSDEKSTCFGGRKLVIYYSNAFLFGLPWFILAGFMSGLLACLVGLGAPPIIVLFQFFAFERNKAKVIWTVVSWFTFRPLIYLAGGGFYQQDTVMYVLSVVSMLVGIFSGSALSSKLSQKWFTVALDALVAMSMVLMFLKAFSLVPAI